MTRAELSTEQLTKRWEDQRAIKNQMGKYVVSMLLEQKAQVFDTYWSRTKEDVCFGLNNGWYSGADAIRAYYDAISVRTKAESDLLQKLFPQQLGSWSEEKVYGVGHMDNRPISSPLISIADDGETAQAMWTCVGTYTDFGAAGPCSHWMWGYYAADFVCEDGSWRIWHLRFITDIDVICGQDWTKPAKQMPEIPEFAALSEYAVPEPNVPCILQEPYHIHRLPMTLPALPHPYAHFTDAISYGM